MTFSQTFLYHFFYVSVFLGSSLHFLEALTIYVIMCTSILIIVSRLSTAQTLCIQQNSDIYVHFKRIQNDDDDDWFPEDIFEAFKELRKRKVFDVDDMYTIADAWSWTWERELKNRCPRRWSQEWEVELAIKVMLKASSNILYFILHLQNQFSFSSLVTLLSTVLYAKTILHELK